MPELLAALCISLNIGLRLAFPYVVGRSLGLPVLNFATWPVIAGLPLLLLQLVGGPLILIEGGLTSPSFQTWVLIESGYLAVQLVINLVVYRLAFFKTAMVEADQGIPTNYLLVAAGVFIIIYLLSFLLTSGLGYGVLNWLKSPRTGYQSYRDSVGPFYAIMATSINIAAFFIFLSLKRSRLRFALSIGSLLPLVYLLGSKGLLLNLLILGVSLYLFQHRKVPLVLVSLSAIPVLVLMIVNFGSADIEDIVRYFDYYPNSTIVYDAVSNGRMAFLDGRVSGSSIWGIAPRALFPDKPYVYGQVILSDLLYPGIATSGHTVAFAGPIDAYVDFGLPGVFLAAVLSPYPWIVALLFGYLARGYADLGAAGIASRPASVMVLLYLINPAALLYLGFPLNLIYLSFIFAVIKFSTLIEIRWMRTG